uniref:Uncharacterized protein n=1 Tax=Sphaerodactylus townsendi TaxID=933632 RepID=A0ACB8F7J6_9SAUR
MGAAREVEPQQPPPEGGGEAVERTDGGSAPGAASPPWNIMIKHRLVQRRGRRSQVMSSMSLMPARPVLCKYQTLFPF